MPLLHRLEQRGLRLRRRAIDLVGEDDVREQRSRDERETSPAGLGSVLKDVGAGDVRWHHVGRELDAAEGQAQDPRDSANQQRLRKTGHTNQQDVGPGEQAGEQVLHHALLADDHLGDLVPHSTVIVGKGGDRCGVAA
jgi:hypothetical protein